MGVLSRFGIAACVAVAMPRSNPQPAFSHGEEAIRRVVEQRDVAGKRCSAVSRTAKVLHHR